MGLGIRPSPMNAVGSLLPILPTFSHGGTGRGRVVPGGTGSFVNNINSSVLRLQIELVEYRQGAEGRGTAGARA